MKRESPVSQIPSIRYFLRIIKRIKPPERVLTFKWIRNIAIVYLLIIGPMVGYALYRIKNAPELKGDKAEKSIVFTPMVKVFKVKKEDYRDVLSTNGTVKGTSEVELKFEISGRIASFNFREGDLVAEGEIIVSLDAADVMTRLRHSKSKLESINTRHLAAREKVNVYRELYEMGAIIEAKMKEIEYSAASMKAEVETARSEVVLAQSHLEKTVIVAPADGVMGMRQIEVSDIVSPNDNVGIFLEVKNVFVEMGVIEKDIKKISMRQKVKVKVDAYPEEIFWGEIDNISKMIRGETRTLPVKVKLSNPGQKLLSGMYADCEIFLAEFKDQIIIPSASIIKLGKMEIAPLVLREGGENDGIIELRKIETGYSSSYTVIKDGLRIDDLVVMETQQPLKDGMKVKIIEVIEAALD